MLPKGYKTLMKKFLYSFLILMIVFGAFLAGSWYSKRETAKVNHLGSKITNHSRLTRALTLTRVPTPPPYLLALLKSFLRNSRQLAYESPQSKRSLFTYPCESWVGLLLMRPGYTFINATVDGWITKAFPNTTGSFIKKNETLAAFYSSEFLSAGQALLFALGSMDRVHTTGAETDAQKGQIAQFNINLQQYKDSLRNLGMGDLQIEEMIRTRKYMENVNVTSPADGIILIRNVSLGQRFEKGRELYRIADISRVWILADVYQNEAEAFVPGTVARVNLPQQKKTYQAQGQRGAAGVRPHDTNPQGAPGDGQSRLCAPTGHVRGCGVACCLSRRPS